MRPPRILSALFCLTVLVVMAGCRQPGSPSGASVTQTASPAVTARHAPRTYLGIREPGAPPSYSPVARFVKAVGYQPQLVLYYSGWGENFQTAFAEQLHAHGSEPLVQIEPTDISLAAIAAGRYDAYLRSYAGQVRAYGHPVVIGFAHEMNGAWYSWGWRHTAPATWVEAWRHVVTVFRRQGASNVTWLWTVNRSQPGLGPLPDYWPGSNYVTWVGIDSYYYWPRDTFQSNFAPTIKQVRAITRKPILLAETAIGQISGQATKIPNLFAGIRRDHLLGLVWYDVHQTDPPVHQDWRLEGHPAAIAAFRKGLAARKS